MQHANQPMDASYCGQVRMMPAAVIQATRTRLPWLGCFLLALLASGSAACLAEVRPFSFSSENDLVLGANGFVMYCPSHKHGSSEEATILLKDQLTRVPAGTMSSIWVCTTEQVETLRRFAPMVDQVYVNPFFAPYPYAASDKVAVWSGADHPFLNRVRELRQVAGERRMIACIDVAGDPRVLERRKATWDEIEWMALSAIGGGYQGIAWRGDVKALPYVSRLREFEASIAPHLAALGTAHPVMLRGAASDQFVATLQSDQTLFVVVIRSSLLALDAEGKVVLPLDQEDWSGQVKLDVPAGYEAAGAVTLSGIKLPIAQDGDGRLAIAAGFRSAGVLIVVNLERDRKASAGSGALQKVNTHE